VNTPNLPPSSIRLVFHKACRFIGMTLLAFAIHAMPSAQAAPATGSGNVPISLVEALESALMYNEDIQETFERIKASEAGVMSAEGAYDLGLFSNTRYGRFNGLSESDYDVPGNPAKSYLRSDSGLRQRVPTGAMASAYHTSTHEELLGSSGGKDSLSRNYLTLEFVQSLLKNIGDKEQQGAIENALLAVEDSLENRHLVVSQTILETIRAYWLLEYSIRNLETAKKTHGMATEVLRRENARFAQGISQGVDVDRAETAEKQRRYSVLRCERDVDVMRERLLLLINHPAHTEYTPLVPTSAPLDTVLPLPDGTEAVEKALQNRYDLKQIHILLKQLDIEKVVNTNKLLPSLDATAGITTAGGNDALRGAENFRDTDDRNSWFVGLNFAYPLQNREARGNLERTKRLARIAADRLNKAERSVETEVREALHNLMLARDGIPVARQAVDSARSALKGELARFEMGGVNNRDLLSAQDVVGQQESAYYLAVAEYNVALAELRHAQAGLLAHFQIIVDKETAKMD
jgi:outer membrane protein TolC